MKADSEILLKQAADALLERHETWPLGKNILAYLAEPAPPATPRDEMCCKHCYDEGYQAALQQEISEPTCTVCGTPMKAGFICPDCGSTPECTPPVAAPSPIGYAPRSKFAAVNSGTLSIAAIKIRQSWRTQQQVLRDHTSGDEEFARMPSGESTPAPSTEAQAAQREGAQWQEEAALFDEIWFSAYMKEPNSDGCCRMCGRYGLNPEATKHNDVCRVPALRQIIRENMPATKEVMPNGARPKQSELRPQSAVTGEHRAETSAAVPAGGEMTAEQFKDHCQECGQSQQEAAHCLAAQSDELGAVVTLLRAKCSDEEWAGMPQELKTVYPAELEKLRQEPAALRSQVGELRKYAEHRLTCPRYRLSITESCTCGLAELLSGLPAEEKELK